MKVVCEYCGSYVEADENMRCPLCVAELGSAVKAEQARIAQEEAAEQARLAEEKAQEAKEEHVSEIIQGIAGVASAVVAGVTASNAAKDESDAREHPPLPPDGERPRHARMGEPDFANKPPRPDGAIGHEGHDGTRPANHEHMRAGGFDGHGGSGGGMRPGGHGGSGGGMRPGGHR